MAEIKKYHAYADHTDAFVNTWPQAQKVVAEWKREGQTNLRIQEFFVNPATGEDRDGEILFAKGQFPW